jgi:hypothetical protein
MSDHWMKLPPSDEIRKKSRTELRALIHGFIEYAERGTAHTLGGGVERALARARYLEEELARRTQNWQTGSIIVMTFVITVMTLVMMLGPPEVWHRLMGLVIRPPAKVPAYAWPAG